MRRSPWPIFKVGDLAATKKNALVGGPFGSNLVSADYVLNGVPVIRGQNMGWGRWVAGEFAFVAEKKAEELSANIAVPGDLIFTQRGTLGQVAIVPEGDFEQYVISQSQMKLTVDESLVDVLFLYYVFCSEEQIEYVHLNAIQTGVPHTNLGILRDTPVRLPPLGTQKEISCILGSLDDKIELNHRMNQALEAMARAIFKSWFVDFDSVREGKPWLAEAGRIAGLAMLSKDPLNPGDYSDELFDHYSIPSFDEGRVAKVESGKEIKSNKFVVNEGSVLLSKLNPRIPRVWLPLISKERRSICSTEFLVVLPRERTEDREYLYSLFCSPEFVDEFASRATGTSGSHQRVRPDDLLSIECPLPEREAREAFSRAVRPMFDKVAQNMEESRTLAALRDTLLPKLLSGEIRIKQAEKIVEEVV